MRTSTGDDRFDVHLPYGNKLVFLRRGFRIWVRLLMIVDGRKTFVTPNLPITHLEIDRLLSGMYAEVDLGPIKLSTEPRELIISFEYRRIPVANGVWQPVTRLAIS